MTPEEKREFEELKQEVQSLRSSTTIRYDVDGAIRERFKDLFNPVGVSLKGVNTEDQAVDEGGSATYNVLKEPDGFLEITISGITYYIPYYG